MAAKLNLALDTLSRPEVPAVVSVNPGMDYSGLAAAQREGGEMDAYQMAASGLTLAVVLFGLARVSVHSDVSTGRPRLIVPMGWRRRVFDAVHGLAHSSVRVTSALVVDKFV